MNIRERAKKPVSRGRTRVREDAAPYRDASTRVSATEAARRFSDLLNRVRYRGESFIIERGGEAICEVKPSAPTRFTGADWLSLSRSLPRVDDGYLDAVESAARAQPRLPKSAWER